jgi:hypothetical protein
MFRDLLYVFVDRMLIQWVYYCAERMITQEVLFISSIYYGCCFFIILCLLFEVKSANRFPTSILKSDVKNPIKLLRVRKCEAYKSSSNLATSSMLNSSDLLLKTLGLSARETGFALQTGFVNENGDIGRDLRVVDNLWVLRRRKFLARKTELVFKDGVEGCKARARFKVFIYIYEGEDKRRL